MKKKEELKQLIGFGILLIIVVILAIVLNVSIGNKKKVESEDKNNNIVTNTSGNELTEKQKNGLKGLVDEEETLQMENSSNENEGEKNIITLPSGEQLIIQEDIHENP